MNNKKNVPLTSLVKTSGCAAKIGPGILHGVLEKLPKFENDNLIVGCDDACVYKVSNDIAAISTVDFFPPMIDDPYSFGQIAAANALSDIYAMGGNPATAMNLVCFPSCLEIDILEEILRGGYSKVQEAGAVIAGGHTIADPTPKYGLCVTGFAHPDHILTNSNAKEGDLLILTKPIGIGIMNTASKAGFLTEEQLKSTIEIMAALNKYAKECGEGLEIHACTDVTGFSLMGHSCEMAEGSNKTIQINAKDIPLIEDALEYASLGLIPEGMYNNYHYLKSKVDISKEIPQNFKDILFDPQTSGGLLLSISAKDAPTYLERIKKYTSHAKIIGQVLPSKEKKVLVL